MLARTRAVPNVLELEQIFHELAAGWNVCSKAWHGWRGPGIVRDLRPIPGESVHPTGDRTLGTGTGMNGPDRYRIIRQGWTEIEDPMNPTRPCENPSCTRRIRDPWPVQRYCDARCKRAGRNPGGLFHVTVAIPMDQYRQLETLCRDELGPDGDVADMIADLIWQEVGTQ